MLRERDERFKLQMSMKYPAVELIVKARKVPSFRHNLVKEYEEERE